MEPSARRQSEFNTVVDKPAENTLLGLIAKSPTALVRSQRDSEVSLIKWSVTDAADLAIGPGESVLAPGTAAASTIVVIHDAGTVTALMIKFSEPILFIHSL